MVDSGLSNLGESEFVSDKFMPNRPMNADPHQRCFAPPARAGYRERYTAREAPVVA